MPSACLIIICGIGSKNSLQVRLAEDDHLIQALAAQCADQTFSIAVLPRRLRRDRSIANVRVGSMLCENVPGQILLRIVFSVVPSRRMLRVLVAFVSPKSRRKFYVPEERQSFHRAWTLNRHSPSHSQNIDAEVRQFPTGQFQYRLRKQT